MEGEGQVGEGGKTHVSRRVFLFLRALADFPTSLSFSLDTAKARLDALYAKQERTTQFRIQADRDKYLKSEIANLATFQASQQERVQGLTAELDAARTKLQEVKDKLEEDRRDLEERKEKSREWQKELAALKEEEGKISDQRK